VILEVKRGHNWKGDPYWLELYEANGRFVGLMWSKRVTIQRTGQGDYSLRHIPGFLPGFSSDFVLWVVPRVVD